jgi:hypothetical protein
MADGVTALMSRDFEGAAAHLKDALRASDDDNVEVNAMLLPGWALEFASGTERLLREGLRFAQLVDDQRNAAGYLEGLGWIAAQKNNPKGAAVMMGAADALARAAGSVAIPTLPGLHVFHVE